MKRSAIRRFAHRLALTPGGAIFGLNVDRLLASLTSRQMTQWLAYAELEPFGPLAESRLAGMIAAAVANFGGMGRPRGSKVIRPEDFFAELRETKPTRHQTAAEIDAEFRKLAPGADLRKGVDETDIRIVRARKMIAEQAAKQAKKTNGKSKK